MKQSSWAFVGGYFLYFLGLVSGFVGAVIAQGEYGRPYGDDTGLMVSAAVGLGMVAFVLGVQVLARAPWHGFKGSPETIVIFVMTPIPGLVAVLINAVGQYFQRADGTFVRVLLLGGGVYLAATTGMDLTNNGLPAGEENPMAFLWPLALQGGVALTLLGLLPPTRTEDADVPYAEVAA